MDMKKDDDKDKFEDRFDDEDEPEWYDDPEDDEDEPEWYDDPEDLEDDAPEGSEKSEEAEKKSEDEPEEKPEGKAVEEPGEKSADEPGEKSADEPGEKSADEPGEKSADEPGKLKEPSKFLRFLGNLGDPADHPGPQRFVTYLLLPLVMIYYEILARLFTRTALFPNLLFPILFAAALGFILSAVLSMLGPKLRWNLTNIIMAVIAFYYGLEVVLRNTYQTYMNLSTIFSELGNVTGNYGGDVANAFKGAIPVIIFYYIPFILRLALRKTYKTPRDYHPQITAATLGCWIGIWGLGVLLAMSLPGTSPKFSSKYEFDTAMRTFGIAEGTGLNMQYSLSGNPNAQQFVKTDTVVEETVDEETVYVDVSEEPEEIVEEIVEEIEEAVDYGYNVMNIDFDALIEETDSEIVKNISEYVNSLEPSAKNEYTGLFEGKNLITISAESFAMQAINEDLTPTLYRLANNGIKFTDFYQPAWGGSTSTGEYSILIGLVPTESTDSMTSTIGDNLYFTTGNQFQRLGYTSLAFHNGTYTYYDRDKTHTNLGYDSFTAFGSGLEDLVPKWSEDEPTFRATMETYIDQQPFNVYYMSYSGHCDYVAGDPKVTQYYDELKEYYGDTYKDTTLYYLCYQMEFEHALTTMVDMLEEAGIADDTVIVICPDHYPYGLAQSSTFGNTEDYLKDLYKVDSYDGFVRDRTSLIIWSGCIEDMGLEVDTPVYSLDILPTISNLFGLEYDSRLLVGRDVFSDEEPLCIWADYSFLTEKGWYNADTGVFLPTTDEEVTDEYIDYIETIVQNKVAFSMAVPKYDYYGILFGEDDVK